VIARSKDAGLTWQRTEVLPGKTSISPDAEIPKIVFSKRDPLVGWAVVAISSPAAIANNGGLLKTTNGGENWDRIAFSDTSLWSVDSRLKNSNEELFIGGFRTSNLQTMIKGDSLVFHSANGSTDWERYQNIPWNTTSDGDTIRNVWMLRYDTVGKKMYMATQVGLYVLDEPPNSVIEKINSTLHIKYHNGVLEVEDDAQLSTNRRW
jgi:hypothetical protein